MHHVILDVTIQGTNLTDTPGRSQPLARCMCKPKCVASSSRWFYSMDLVPHLGSEFDTLSNFATQERNNNQLLVTATRTSESQFLLSPVLDDL